MADESKTIILPENQSNNGWNAGIPLAFAMNPWGYGNGYGNNGFFGGSGFGAGILGGLLGGLIWGGIGGNGLFGWGNNGNGGAAAASLGAQATANNNAETILRAIDGTDSDVRLLATTLNTDVNTVKQNLATIQNGLTQISGQTGLSAQQIINSIQAGNSDLAYRLCDCCCSMRQLVQEQGFQNQLATVNQTNTLGTAISGSGQRTVDAIADLKTTMVKEFCDAKERDMQNEINTKNEIITQLRNEADNARQSNQIMGYIGSVIAPLQKDIDDMKCKLPSTVAVPYPQLSVVNTTPNFGPNYGGYYGGGYFGGFGNGFGGNIVF